MLGISLRDKIRNEVIRQKTKVTEVVWKCSKLKWQWAGHIYRRTDRRWSRRVLEWKPRLGKRSIGRSPARCSDDLKREVIGWLKRGMGLVAYTGGGLRPDTDCNRLMMMMMMREVKAKINKKKTSH